MWLQLWSGDEGFDCDIERFGNQQKWEFEEEATTFKEEDELVYGFVDCFLGIFCWVCNEFKLTGVVDTWFVTTLLNLVILVVKV